MTISITGRNQHGEIITETIPDDILTGPCEGIIEYVTREQYASIGLGEAFIEITRSPTFNESMEDLCLACGKLMIALLQEATKLAMLPLRFLMWLNG